MDTVSTHFGLSGGGGVQTGVLSRA
jgi:hypothetical protein